MKQTLFAIGITTLALAVGAVAEDKVPNKRAAATGKGANRATTTASARTNTGANVRGRQFTAHQNTSARAFNRQATMNAQTSVRANRVTARERNIRRAQMTTNNAAVTNATTGGRFARQQAVREQRAQQRAQTTTNNAATGGRFARQQVLREQRTQQRAFNANTNRDVTVNRTRNINRNVTVVNNWRGAQFAGRPYVAFRNYHRQWHDRGWWRNHCDRLIFVSGGWWFWNGGFWYPAWGYDPGYYYPYDGPIYGYSDLTPDQIVANVQLQLQRDGYYDGPIDGVLGPQTRYALAQFQADHGLVVTSAVDEPTLATLGLA